MRRPSAVVAVAPERGLDHAAPPVKPRRSLERTRRAARAALDLMAHVPGGLHAPQQARPPGHKPARAARLPGLEPRKLEPRLRVSVEQLRPPHLPPPSATASTFRQAVPNPPARRRPARR